ncbi:MAG TPA: hypothetical protein VJ385_10600 [Fibrobacteria bacterium]|nr:hypothetical protein [Fibrobacteria bacterium]
MKHPFTGEYLKMAAAAQEVQIVRLAGMVFQSGDYVIFESAFTPAGMVSMIDEHSHNIPQDNAKVWLPQLRQLMDMFGDFTASLEAFRSGLGNPVAAGAPPGYFEKFKSWEECTLAVLMLKKTGKIWNGREWGVAGVR